MTEQPPRQCPECGCDRWKMRQADRLYDANLNLHESLKKAAAENGILKYQATLAEAEHRAHTSRLSRKVIKQARVIVRLEARLRALKQRPYEDAPLGETAPNAGYDQHDGDA